MQVDRSVSVRTLRAQYRAACAASNEIIAAVGDADAPVTHNGRERDLRWAVLAVIQETARHVGHADIIREQIDGQTGLLTRPRPRWCSAWTRSPKCKPWPGRSRRSR